MPQSIRDLDLNRAGFEEEALRLPIGAFSKVLKSDDLKCRSEDHVLGLALNYIDAAQQRVFHEARRQLMPLIKLDLLSKERLVELSTDKSGLIQGMEA